MDHGITGVVHAATHGAAHTVHASTHVVVHATTHVVHLVHLITHLEGTVVGWVEAHLGELALQLLLLLHCELWICLVLVHLPSSEAHAANLACLAYLL